MTYAHRVLKRQPEGGLTGFGGSPVMGGRSSRLDGSVVGAEAKSACVYGCFGASASEAADAEACSLAFWIGPLPGPAGPLRDRDPLTGRCPRCIRGGGAGGAIRRRVPVRPGGWELPRRRVYVSFALLPGDDSFRVAFDALARDRFVLGSADDVIQQIEERVTRLDSNFFVFRVGWPGMENWKVLRVLELMGERVLPYFRAKYPLSHQGSRP